MEVDRQYEDLSEADVSTHSTITTTDCPHAYGSVWSLLKMQQLSTPQPSRVVHVPRLPPHLPKFAGKASLEGCLSAYTAPELMLCAQGNGVDCSQCKRRTDHVLAYSIPIALNKGAAEKIREAPKYLIMYLK